MEGRKTRMSKAAKQRYETAKRWYERAILNGHSAREVETAKEVMRLAKWQMKTSRKEAKQAARARKVALAH